MLWLDLRGADGEATWDVSQWTAPGFDYDLAKAIVTPRVAIEGGRVTDEDVTNIALSVLGSGAGATKVAPHGGIGMPCEAMGKVPGHLAKKVDDIVEIYRDPRPSELKEPLMRSEMKALRVLRLKDSRIFAWPAE